jgi:hypothetical protein
MSRLRFAVLPILLVAACSNSAPGTTPTEDAGPASPTSAPASTTPTAKPVEEASIDTEAWPVYESERYGFSIGHPPEWTVISADHDWTLAGDADSWLSTGQEAFVSPFEDVRVSAWSVPMERTAETPGAVQTWVERYCREAGSPCADVAERSVQLCNERRDCHPGLLVPFESDVQAFFTGGEHHGQMVVVAVWRQEDYDVQLGSSRQLLEAFLSTMDVCPYPPGGPLSGCQQSALEMSPKLEAK